MPPPAPYREVNPYTELPQAPLWSRNGSELLYVNANRDMAAAGDADS